MAAIIEEKPTLRMINSDDGKPIEVWEHLYPDLWLFIEVTQEDEWDVYEGKLVATAVDSIEFVEIAKAYHERGIVNLTTRGIYIEPLPLVIV